MPGGLGPRFALEAGFLILLAAVAAYAQLDATEIILVMAGGWMLASIFEVLAARRERLYPGTTWERRVETTEAPAESDAVQEAERRLSWFRRPAEATAPAVEEAVAPQPAPPPPVAEADDESTGEIELPKRRRWFRRSRAEPETLDNEIEVRPSARHVRLITERTSEGAAATPSERTDAAESDAEAGS